MNPAENNISFDFILQVWRPSPTVNQDGCYSLVDEFMITSTSIAITPPSDHVARVTPLPAEDQLQFQPGDVLGFYVESHGPSNQDNGVVLLNNTDCGYTSELVWYGSISALNSQTGSCPYPVGTSGSVLHSSTRAAPVISISTIKYSCPQSLPTLVPTLVPTTSTSISNTPFIVTASVTSPDQQLPRDTSTSPGSMSGSVDYGLIAGVVVTIVIVCVLTLVIVIIASAIVVKKRNTMEKTFDTTNSSMALSNQVYGESVSYKPTSVLFFNPIPLQVHLREVSLLVLLTNILTVFQCITSQHL